MSYSGLLENIKEKARSAYSFIAVCDSARNEGGHTHHAPRSGAGQHRYAAFGVGGVHISPCAIAQSCSEDYKALPIRRIECE